MGGTAAVNAVPIVGQPVAYGAGFIALVIVGLSRTVGQYFSTLAHEGGHVIYALFTGRQNIRYNIDDNTEGATTHDGSYAILIYLVGYPAGALLGLGGAALIAAGNTWAFLAVLVIFSALHLFVAKGGLAIVIPAVVIAGVFAAALRGSEALQAGLATGAAWFLLLGATYDAFALPTDAGDAMNLARRTVVIPGFVWKLIWIAIAVVSLYAGGRLLLVPGA